MPGKCIFNNLWLLRDEYKLWIEPVSGNKNRARCKLCTKEFDISKMGEAALKSHMKGMKHMSLSEASKKTKVQDYFCSAPVFDKAPVATNRNGTIESYTQSSEVINAEIKWALKCINNHFSMHSCEGINSLFAEMFPDSNIAKQFSCGPAKCAYIVSFGLAPYFKAEIASCLNNLEQYTILFDESLNKATQSKQMDILLRYWDEEAKTVKTRYYTSVFLGHSTAQITLQALLTGLEKLHISRILNVSMDGPAVNWKVYTLLQEQLQREHNCSLLNIGSCSLHVINNCFKSGSKATNWDIDNLLVSLYWLFKDSPARREDFLLASNGANLPRKFCAHRWLENVPAAQRAIEIWDEILAYIEAVEKGKFQKPSCKSYKVVFQFSKDPLVLTKLHSFISVSNILLPFLTRYQSDFPLLPFLADDLKKIAFDCLESFNILKSDKVIELKKGYNICNFDFDEKSFSSISKVSLGFVADKLLKELMYKKKVSPKDMMDVKHDMQKFICTLVENIINKSSIKYSLVRNINCLDPRYMTGLSSKCYIKMKRILSNLVQIKKINESVCDATLLEFNDFLNNIVHNDWKDYNPYETRLDDFFYKLIGNEKKYEKVWHVVKMFLIVSHGQGTIERGFSVNRHLEVENLQEETYIAKRLVLDKIKECGGFQNINITKELRISVAGARQKYLAHLEQKKLQSEKSESKKRKHLDSEIAELKQKKSRLQRTADELQKSADTLAEKAEKTESVQFITQSNSFRRTAKEKLQEIQEIDSKINSMLSELKKQK